MTNFDKIRSIIAEELEIDENLISLESRLVEDLGADSLSLIEMLMNYESEYDVEIPEEAFDNIETVQDVVNALDRL